MRAGRKINTLYLATGTMALFVASLLGCSPKSKDQQPRPSIAAEKSSPTLVDTPPPLPQNPLPDAPHFDQPDKPKPQIPHSDEAIAEASSKFCSDPGFGQNGLEACLVGESKLVSRYDSFEIQFALRTIGGNGLIQSSIEEHLQFIDQHGQTHDFDINWLSARSLQIQPRRPLVAGKSYQIKLKNQRSASNRPRSLQGELVRPFTKVLLTQAKFPIQIVINGRDYGLERSLSFDKRSDQEIFASFDFGDFDLMRDLHLRQLGRSDSLLICDRKCPALLELDLSSSQLAPRPGINSYYLEWQSPWGSLEQRHFSFSWGTLADDPNKALTKSMKIAVDEAQSLKTIGSLLESYVAGNFELALDGDDVAPYRFNDLLQMHRHHFPEDPPMNCHRPNRRNFSYLRDLGPFCDIFIEGSTGVLGGFLGQVQYRATTDIYVTSMELAEDPDNIRLAMRPQQGHMAIDLDVRQFRGTLLIVLNIEDAKLAGITVPGTKGIYVFETEFQLNGPFRKATAHVDLKLLEQELQFAIFGIEGFDLDRSLNGSRSSPQFFDTRAWADHVIVSRPQSLSENQGLWARVVNAIVDQAVAERVEDLTPRVVNGIARDILQVVAPKPLQSIMEQIRYGLEIPFAFYLPPPFNQLSARLAGELEAPLQVSRSSRLGGFLSSGFSGMIDLISDGSLSPPPALDGPASFVLSRGSHQVVDDPLSLYPGSTAPQGSLLSVDMNLVNQLIFQLWQQGAFNIRINEEFTRYIESFAVFDPDQQSNGKEILLIEFIPKLLGQNYEHLTGFDEFGQKIRMQPSDEVSLDLEIRLPPYVELLDGNTPSLRLDAGEVFITIRGHRQGFSYIIAQLKMAVSSTSQLGFRHYSNPFEREYFENLGALSLEVYSDRERLDFVVEVIEGQSANPFGIDAKRLERAVRDMVDELFIPLMNDTLREVPLTGLKTCGIELDAANIRLHGYRGMKERQTLLLEAPIRTYPFTGVCRLEPDFVPPENFKPAPPSRPEPVEPPTLAPEGQDYVFDMDLNRLPFTIGEVPAIPEISPTCRNSVFFELSCATAQVIYQKDANGQELRDERGRKIYDHTEIKLFALVSKSSYDLKSGDGPSIEGQFFDFDNWPDYIRGMEQHIIMHDSVAMNEISISQSQFMRHYVDYATNSPKASGFIPIRNVTLHRILPESAVGAEISTEFFVDTSSFVAVPEGRLPLAGAFGLEYHVGNIHVLDCGKLSWCQDQNYWLVIYDSRLRPEDTSIPEDVLPYLRNGLNAILSGMFPD